MNERHSRITARLRALAEQAVDDQVAHGHLMAMQAQAQQAPRRRFGRLAVAGAAIVGFTAGSTGLAAAGALPGPAQGVAHDVLGAVGVEVPDNRGRCVSAAARAHPDDEAAKQAAKDACPRGGKPEGVGRDAGRGRGGPAAGRIDDGDPCKGPPVWAGRGRPTAEERQSREAERQSCPADSDDEPQAATGAAQPQPQPAPEPEAQAGLGPQAEPQPAPEAETDPEADPDGGLPVVPGE